MQFGSRYELSWTRWTGVASASNLEKFHFLGEFAGDLVESVDYVVAAAENSVFGADGAIGTDA